MKVMECVMMGWAGLGSTGRPVWQYQMPIKSNQIKDMNTDLAPSRAHCRMCLEQTECLRGLISL